MAIIGLAVWTPATASDLHRMWDSRCAECHSHSADFARKYLKLEDGKLIGRHPVRDVRIFLGKHYPPGNAVERIYAMLKAQVETEPRFAEECADCHERAAILVRESILRKQDKLWLKQSGEPLHEFLPGHQGLTNEDMDFYLALFSRVEQEVFGKDP